MVMCWLVPLNGIMTMVVAVLNGCFNTGHIDVQSSSPKGELIKCTVYCMHAQCIPHTQYLVTLTHTHTHTHTHIK